VKTEHEIGLAIAKAMAEIPLLQGPDGKPLPPGEEPPPEPTPEELLRELEERDQPRNQELEKSLRPPKGFTPIPGGRKGGYRKRVGNKWTYWYPETGAGASRGGPLRTESYGGLPSDGDFERIMEYGVALANVCEAAHCILGSLGRGLGPSRNDWGQMRRTEQGHLEEEAGIIVKASEEYTRNVYVRDMLDFEQYKVEARDRVRDNANRQVADIQKQAPVLRELARRKEEELVEHEAGVPADVMTAALATYRLVGVLCETAISAVSDYPKALTHPFSDLSYKLAARKLERSVSALFAGSDVR